MPKKQTTPVQDKHRFSQFLPRPLWKLVKAHAVKNGTSVTQVLEDLARQRFIGRRPVKPV